jgi:hypothetical protein
MNLQLFLRDAIRAFSVRYSSRDALLTRAGVSPQTHTRGSNLAWPDHFHQAGGVTVVLLWTSLVLCGEIGVHVIVLSELLQVLTMCPVS